MLTYLTLIFSCQLAGELVVGLLGLPLPGPVLGMALLFAFLLWRGAVPEGLEAVSGTLLKYMSLLFVPAGTGVMLHFRLLGENILPIGVAMVVSTLVTIVVTGALMQWLSKAEAQDG